MKLHQKDLLFALVMEPDPQEVRFLHMSLFDLDSIFLSYGFHLCC